MNLKRENRVPLLLVTLMFLVLIFLEWRTIRFQMWGNRSISPADLFFLSGVGLLYFRESKKEGYLYPFKQTRTLWYLLLPIVLMFLFYSNQTALGGVSASFPRFTLMGLTAYLVIVTVALMQVPKESLLTYILGFVLAVTTFTVFDFAFTRCLLWKPFLYGEGTPALHFPFGSPSQAALFMLLNLILGIGAALALKKHYLLYYMTPILFIGTFQTASRSISYLLVIGLAGFLLLILLRGLISKRFPWREITHMLLSTVLAVVCLFSTLDSQGIRALTIFAYSPEEIASGKIDGYRSEIWRQELTKLFVNENSAINSYYGFGEVQGLHNNSAINLHYRFGELRELHNNGATDSHYRPGEARGLHNAYLDIWLNWGIWSFLSFLVFVFFMLYLAIKSVWGNRNETDFPLYAALLSGVVVVVGAIYGNPLLQLKFVWIFFGLAVTLYLREIHKNMAGHRELM